MATITQDALDTLFLKARTFYEWEDKAVPEAVLHEMFDLLKMGPTSGNCQPIRLVFVRSPEAKEKLKPCLDKGNVEKVMSAPVTAIVGMDMEFYDKLPKFHPFGDARSWFAGNPPLIESTAFRNSSLQGAYLILAARVVGLGCGPMSGFDNAKVDAAFFAGTKVKSNFICNLGYGKNGDKYPRLPRPDFAEFCRFE